MIWGASPMLSTLQVKSRATHPLQRFVTREAIALLLNLHPDEIYRIDCWRYVIHVVGKGVSTFVSYADIPPILGVDSPTLKDTLCWRRRWRKHRYKAPDFWATFYQRKFEQSLSQSELYQWGELVNRIQFGLSDATLKWLRSIYIKERESFNF